MNMRKKSKITGFEGASAPYTPFVIKNANATHAMRMQSIPKTGSGGKEQDYEQ